MDYRELLFTARALNFEDAAEMLGLSSASLQQCLDNSWLRKGFQRKDLTLYDAVDLQQLWQRLRNDPEMAKSIKLKGPLHFSAVGVEPLAVSSRLAAKMMGMSGRRFKQLVEAGWIAPALEQGTLTLYDAEDVRGLWHRLKEKGWPK